MIALNHNLSLQALAGQMEKFWELSAEKIRMIGKSYDEKEGSPVYTVNGRYTSRGWTEWTRGFQYGSSLLQYDATGDEEFLNKGRSATRDKMAAHLTHMGVHDHGFNNISTYGNLLRMMKEGKIAREPWEKSFYELAIKVSAAVQASRWTGIPGGGFIYSFNGPHSLFVDTIRTCRILGLGHMLGHVLMGENDRQICLPGRMIDHLLSTAKYSVYYGEGRDRYDVPGRTAHECIFNIHDGSFRCPNSQQGYSGFTTWTRGLAWAICGFAEQLEFIHTLEDSLFLPHGGKQELSDILLKAATATAGFYIEKTPRDGIPYWDTGAPGLSRLEGYLEKDADPFNSREPVDSSAASIAAQGLLRLGRFLDGKEQGKGEKYRLAGIRVATSLLDVPYLSTDPGHQGLILHSVYHHPNGWDHVPEGSRIPYGESSMWGDYHARELMLYIQRMTGSGEYLTFYNI